MMNSKVSQQEIANWFNRTYTQKGERYLRPINAYFIFLELLKARAGQPLLDVACGLGRLLEAAKDYGCDLYGIDISDVAVSKAAQKLPSAQIQLANAEALPFADKSFELVTCLGSLERMLDLNKVLGELHRVGVDDAQYCFLVRNANTLRWKLLKQKLGMRNQRGHQGAKTLTQWKEQFSKANFDIINIYPDQYPLQKRKKWLSAGLASIDPKALLFDKKDLETANEFIFLLRKVKP